MHLSHSFESVTSVQSEKPHKLFLTGPDHGSATTLAYAKALQKDKYPDRKIDHIDGNFLSQQDWTFHSVYFSLFSQDKILVITDFDTLTTNVAKNIHKRGGIGKNPNSPALYEIMAKLERSLDTCPVMIFSAERNAFNRASKIIPHKDKNLQPLFAGFQSQFDIEETSDVIPASEKKSLFANIRNIFKPS